MENEFAKVMTERTDDESIDIVTVEREKYKPTAIEAAASEIEKRKIYKTITFPELKNKIQSIEEDIHFLK